MSNHIKSLKEIESMLAEIEGLIDDELFVFDHAMTILKNISNRCKHLLSENA